MPHPAEHDSASRVLSAAEAGEIAETLKALGSAPRLRLLIEMMEGERTVEELARAAGLEPSATSHHLRILRTLRLARVRRSGRHAHYALHDHHIGELLAAVRHHHEHLYPPPAAELESPPRAGAAP